MTLIKELENDLSLALDFLNKTIVDIDTLEYQRDQTLKEIELIKKDLEECKQ